MKEEFLKKGSFLRDGYDIGGGQFVGEDVHMLNVQQLTTLVETTPEAIAELLPAPLEPLENPYILFAAMRTPNLEFYGKKMKGYLETAIYIPAKHGDDIGYYSIAMHLNGDMPIFYGRDCWGYPKKLANIKMYYDEEETFVCWEERHGIPIFCEYAKLDGVPNDPDFMKAYESVMARSSKHPGCGVNLTFKWANGKHISGELGDTFIHTPFLIKAPDRCDPVGVESKIGSVDLKLVWSDNDPWAGIPIKKVFGCCLDTFNYTMYGTYEAFEVPDEKEFEKFAFNGFDYGGGHMINFGGGDNMDLNTIPKDK